MAEPQYLPVKVADLPVITDTDGLEFLGFQNQVFGRGDIELLKAKNMQLQYSNDSVNWHSTPVDGDMYFHTSNDGGVTWSQALLYSDRSYTDGKIAAEAAARHTEITTHNTATDAHQDIRNTLAGAQSLSLTGALLTRVIGGTTGVAKNLFATGTVFTVGKTLVFDDNGTGGVYTGDLDSATINVLTQSISPIGSDEPTLLGNVNTDDGSAGLPQTSTDAQTVFNRTPNIDDYAKTVSSDGVVTEWFITGIDASGNITWGNPVVINTSDYQSQTVASDAGKVLTGGATPGTFGESLSVDTSPTQSSANLVSSGGVWSWFGAALSTLKTTSKTIIGAINELFDTKVDSATIGSASVTKSGTTLQLPAYPTSLPASGGTANTLSKTGVITDILAYIQNNRTYTVRMYSGYDLVNAPEANVQFDYIASFTGDLAWGVVFAVSIYEGTDTIYKIKWLNGSWGSWVKTNDGGNAATVNGKKFDIYVQSTEPTSSLPGDIWIKP